MTKLEPTYGNFTLRGEVVWKDRSNAFREGTSGSGYPYRAVRFGVKTSDKNIVEVELFQVKFDKVTLQNKETKKRDLDVSYGDHYDLPNGYQLFMPIHLGIERDEDGENIREKMIPYDAAKYIDDTLENGDTVFIFGSPRFSEFKNREGDVIPQVTFEPRGIFLGTTPYEDEEFVGESVFDQELILNKAEKKGDKLMVHTYIVTDRKGNFTPHTFYIDINKYKKFAMNVNRLKFGTKLKVEGIIHHTVEEQEVEQEDDGWGESPVQSTITRVNRSLEITKANKPQREDIGKFTKEDFVRKENKSEQGDNPFAEDNSEGSDWGDSPSSDSSDNPFDEDDPFSDPFA